jgi:tetratricopeptide (TPR) repeat protein
MAPGASDAPHHLVDIYSGPESYVAVREQFLTAAGIPFERAPGVAGYPLVDPMITIRVPAGRADEARKVLIAGMSGPSDIDPNEVEGDWPLELRQAWKEAVRGKSERGRERARNYLARHRDERVAWQCAAEIEIDLGDEKAAEAILQEGLQVLPRAATLRFVLGHMVAKQGRLEEAHSIFDAMTRETPTAPQGHVGLALLASWDNRIEQARHHTHEAYERLDPVYQPASAHVLAVTALKLGDRVMALELFQEAVNWFHSPIKAIVVAVLRELDPSSSSDDVQDAYYDARRLWEGDDSSFEERVEDIRKSLEQATAEEKGASPRGPG